MSLTNSAFNRQDALGLWQAVALEVVRRHRGLLEAAGSDAHEMRPRFEGRFLVRKAGRTPKHQGSFGSPFLDLR